MLNKMADLIGFLSHLKVKFNVERYMYALIQSFKVYKFVKQCDIWKDIID